MSFNYFSLRSLHMIQYRTFFINKRNKRSKYVKQNNKKQKDISDKLGTSHYFCYFELMYFFIFFQNTGDDA